MDCFSNWTQAQWFALATRIALAMAKGPAAGLAVLDELATDKSFSSNYRTEAARAHLIERAGMREQAILHFRRAADSTPNAAERNFLLLHASRLAEKT
jgi:predicted RNA polymerase sigma factor